MLNYIDDGYTEDGYIAAIPGLHGEFRFTFRPMLVAERSTVLGKHVLDLPESQQDITFAKAMASRLKSWSLVDKNGKPVPINQDVAMRLKPALFRRLFAIIAGTEAADPDPLATTVALDQAAEDALAAAVAGTSVRQLTEERDAKNSVAASDSC